MTRHFRLLTAIAAAIIAFAGTLHGAGGGTISGTVTIAGLASGADTVVFIQQMPNAAPPATPVEMNQRGYEFLPKVLPVVEGTTVRFLNNDQVAHNVFSPDYEKYDLGSWTQGQTKDHLFAECAKPPCAYTQLCKTHPQMDAYIVVLQNQYFAVADKAGHYAIRDVPPGDYIVSVWHARRYGAASKAVTVSASAPAVLNFALTRQRLSQ